MSENCIYYPTTAKPTAGGQFVNEAHVIALRQMGVRAYLLYCSPDASVHYFATAAPVLRWYPHMVFDPGDVVVVPEPWKPGLEYFASQPCLKVVHCQNPFYMFHAFDSIKAVEALGYQLMLSCSNFTTQKLRDFGYQAPIYTVRPFIPDYFYASIDSPGRQLQIAYMPRKRANESIFIKGLFKSLYPQFAEIEWVAIENLDRQQCAGLLQESAIFLALSFTEGLGLPPLEAMAAGCLVVGFHGLGGVEYARDDNGFWVAEGDYEGFVAEIARAIDVYLNPQARGEMQQAAFTMAGEFSEHNFKQQLTSAWQSVLGEDYERFLLAAD